MSQVTENPDYPFRCPNCGAVEGLTVEVSVIDKVEQEGDGAFQTTAHPKGGDRAFDGCSTMACPHCVHVGTVASFQGNMAPPSDLYKAFVDQVANLGIWEHEAIDSEIPVPTDGYEDSHKALVGLIEKARSLNSG